MSAFHGTYIGRKDPRTRTKGVLKDHKENLRLDAELRDALLPEDSPKRRRNRLDLEPVKPVRRRNRQRKGIESVTDPELRKVMETVLEEDEDLMEHLAKTDGPVYN